MRDEQADGLRVDDGVAVAELAGIVHLDGDAGEALDHELAGGGGVPAGAAGGDVDVAGVAEGLVGNLHLGEEDFAGVERDAAQGGVADGAGLLKDFLEHEVLVAALFRLDGIPEDALEGALDGVAVEVGELDALAGEDGHVAVGEEVEIAGVVEDAGDVGGDEVFAIADADDGGGSKAGDDDFVGVVGGEDAEGEGSGEALHGAADGVFEGNGVAGFFVGGEFLLDEVGDDFGISLGYKFVALADELLFELEVVFDDAVVDDDEAAGAVAMGVGVFFGGAAVGGPAGMADAEGAVDGLLEEDVFELAELAGSAAELEAVAIAADGDAGGVVAAIFEAAESFNDDGDDFRTVADVTDDAAHRF